MNFAQEDAFARRLAVIGCLLAILGSKIWVIANYGSATPFWDQWDAEAAVLYRPWLDGTLDLRQLIATHNEHRIVLTRLAALALLLVQGHWDPILQMLFNAVVHTAAAGGLLVIVGRPLGLPGRRLLALAILLFFAVPFGWENTLAGFQLQFYLLILLAPLSLYLLYDTVAGSARWWLGTLVAIGSYFTIASGALTLPAFACVAAVQYALGRRSGRGERLGFMLHILVAALLLSDIPSIREHDVLKAQSLREGWRALMAIAAWPATIVDGRILLLTPLAAVVQAPALTMTLRLLRQRPALSDSRWVYIALTCWSGLQLAALAYGRGMGALVGSRYHDILIVGVLVNVGCLLALLRRSSLEPARRSMALAAGGVWLSIILAGAAASVLDPLLPGLTERHETGVIQTENVRRYVETGDPASLENKPTHHIPYPTAGPLIERLAIPSIRAILPPVLLGQPETNTLEVFVLKRGVLLIPIGLAFMIAGMAARRLSPSRD